MKFTTPDEYKSYEPIGDKVLLVLDRVNPEKLVDVGGGILADQNAALKATPIRETVIFAAGPECKQAEVGDTVMWNRLNASPFPFGDKDLYFLPENHLICITKKVGKKNGFPYPVDGAPEPGGTAL